MADLNAPPLLPAHIEETIGGGGERHARTDFTRHRGKAARGTLYVLAVDEMCQVVQRGAPFPKLAPEPM